MKTSRACALALAAGCAASASAQTDKVMPVRRGETITAAYIVVNGQRFSAHSPVADDLQAIYDNGVGTAATGSFTTGSTPRWHLLDDLSFNPGPGAGAGRTISSISIAPATGATVANPMAPVAVRVRIWDTLNAAANPITTDSVMDAAIVFNAPAAGWAVGTYYVSNEIDLSGLPAPVTTADDAILFDQAYFTVDGAGNPTTTPNTDFTCVFASNTGPIQTAGSSAATYYRDADASGDFQAAESRSFAAPAVANFILQLKADVAPQVTGACCLPGGTCSLLSAAACRAQGGMYSGDNVACAQANCAAQGACCKLDGTCALADIATCVSTMNGIYRGAGTSCASGSCPSVFSYAGAPVPIPDGDNLGNCGVQAIATIVVPAGSAFTITGVDAAFNIPHTWQGDVRVTLKHVDTGTSVLMVDQPGAGNFSNDNFGASTADAGLFRAIASAAGIYNLPFQPAGIDNVRGQWKPENVLSAFNGQSSAGTWQLIAEDCFSGDTGAINAFKLSLAGAAAPQACYPNCDGSTTVPFLNVLDFNCFINKFTAGASYANCDNSTTAPVLNVLDFNCFINKFTAGCSAP
jgi:subtilisin-like proprotein convertase family protein